ALGVAATTLGGALFRQRTEEQLRESEERFRLLSEAAAEGVLIHDNGIILDANVSLARMFGYDLPELLGQNVIEMLSTPESREVVLAHVRAGSTARLEVSGRRKDGTQILVEVTGRPTTYRGRQVRVATLYDITDRRRAEATARRLAESEARRLVAEDARRRATFLAEAGRVLGTSFDYQTTLSMLSRLAVPEFADYCIVDILDDRASAAYRTAATHMDPAKEALLHQVVRFARGDRSRRQYPLA